MKIDLGVPFLSSELERILAKDKTAYFICADIHYFSVENAANARLRIGYANKRMTSKDYFFNFVDGEWRKV